MKDMKVCDLIEAKKLWDSLNVTSSEVKSTESDNMWKIGKKYFIRTVTMAQVGKLIAVTPNELLLENCSWIADTGRFHNSLKDGVFDEIEPFLNDVIVNRNAVIDATEFNHDLPKEQK